MFENDYLQKYLPEVVSDASTFTVDASKESSILVSNDDGNDGFDVKKVPYSPCFIYNSQSITSVKTITLPANSPYDGQSFKVVFKNGHNCANASTPMTLNGKPVLVNVNGTLSALPIHTMTEDGGTVYKSLQANTVLDIYYNANYDGNGTPAFVIVGNPLVLSSATYSIYANGYTDYFNYYNTGTVVYNYGNTVTVPQDGYTFSHEETVPSDGFYLIRAIVSNHSETIVASNSTTVSMGGHQLLAMTTSQSWQDSTDSIVVPLKKGTNLNFATRFEPGWAGRSIDYSFFMLKLQ
jgi:hypothetical protein